MWKHAIKVAMAAGEALAKGFTKAVKEEVRATQQAAQSHAARTGQSTSEAKQCGTTNAKLGITLDESMQILNVKTPLCPEEVQKKYDHLFNINDKTKGGSFYLQSKVFRAKERIDEELKRQNEASGEKQETTHSEEPEKKAENSK